MGECEKNPWMAVHCRQACNQCGNFLFKWDQTFRKLISLFHCTLQTSASITTNIFINEINYKILCFRAQTGECHKNRDYMNTYCSKACGYCDGKTFRIVSNIVFSFQLVCFFSCRWTDRIGGKDGLCRRRPFLSSMGLPGSMRHQPEIHETTLQAIVRRMLTIPKTVSLKCPSGEIRWLSYALLRYFPFQLLSTPFEYFITSFFPRWILLILELILFAYSVSIQ